MVGACARRCDIRWDGYQRNEKNKRECKEVSLADVTFCVHAWRLEDTRKGRTNEEGEGVRCEVEGREG